MGEYSLPTPLHLKLMIQWYHWKDSRQVELKGEINKVAYDLLISDGKSAKNLIVGEKKGCISGCIIITFDLQLGSCFIFALFLFSI